MYLVGLFNLIMEEETCPENWSNIVLTMIYKKGDPGVPENYRGIALVDHLTKTFTSFLKTHLEKFLIGKNILPESQIGFRQSKSCTDAIFTLIATIQPQLRHEGREIYAIFVDFKCAFNMVPHQRLWNKLANLGISNKFI